VVLELQIQVRVGEAARAPMLGGDNLAALLMINCVGWAKSAAPRRRASRARDFAHASMHIQRVGNGAPDFELAADAPARHLPTLLLLSGVAAEMSVYEIP
jgi:hypothetical protein